MVQATAGLPGAAWHLATLDHFSALTHTQAHFHLWENGKKLFLAAPDPFQPVSSILWWQAWKRKSLLKVKVQGSSRGVAPASQGEAGSLDSPAGLWQGNIGKLPPRGYASLVEP